MTTHIQSAVKRKTIPSIDALFDSTPRMPTNKMPVYPAEPDSIFKRSSTTIQARSISEAAGTFAKNRKLQLSLLPVEDNQSPSSKWSPDTDSLISGSGYSNSSLNLFEQSFAPRSVDSQSRTYNIPRSTLRQQVRPSTSNPEIIDEVFESGEAQVCTAVIAQAPTTPRLIQRPSRKSAEYVWQPQDAYLSEHIHR